MTIVDGKTHYKWPFSIAMLNYQRVYGVQRITKPAHHSRVTIHMRWTTKHVKSCEYNRFFHGIFSTDRSVKIATRSTWNRFDDYSDWLFPIWDNKTCSKPPTSTNMKQENSGEKVFDLQKSTENPPKIHRKSTGPWCHTSCVWPLPSLPSANWDM
jgi:hypothetical protein